MLALIVIALLVFGPAIATFAIVFGRTRVGLDRAAGLGGMATAVVIGGGARWTTGRAAQRVARHVPVVQAGLVAFGAAAIAFMVASLAVAVTLALAA
ncbi:MAG: hypothetical protein K8W52_06185 [Deltaproteobacteria bacterium]|nr:hypothetical protein [Deltaproteobacteria bacterium]